MATDTNTGMGLGKACKKDTACHGLGRRVLQLISHLKSPSGCLLLLLSNWLCHCLWQGSAQAGVQLMGNAGWELTGCHTHTASPIRADKGKVMFYGGDPML